MAEFKEAPANATRAQKFMTWVDNRFPATQLWNEHVGQYYAPKNFNFWYIFGSLAMLVLVIQIVTGIFLTMNYKPDSTKAFESVEYIMRDVEWGWSFATCTPPALRCFSSSSTCTCSGA